MLSTISIQDGHSVRPFKYRKGSSDEATIAQIFIDRHYDITGFQRHAELRQWMETRTANGARPLIIDAGANIGASAVFFALNFPGAAVAAIEPNRDNHALLVENTRGLDVHPFLAGVASRAGRLRVTDGVGSFDSYRTERLADDEAEDTGVPALTIPNVLAAFGAGYVPFIVKIDIEGGEKDLFSADTDWLEVVPLVVIELHDWLLPGAGTALPFLRCIARHERDFIVRGENVFSIAHRLPDGRADG